MRPFWVTLIIFGTVVACVSFLVVSCSAVRGAELEPVASKSLAVRHPLLLAGGVSVQVAVRPVVVVRRHPRRVPVVVIVR